MELKDIVFFLLATLITGLGGVLLALVKKVWDYIKVTFDNLNESINSLTLQTTDLHYSRIAMLDDIKECKKKIEKLENKN